MLGAGLGVMIGGGLLILWLVKRGVLFGLNIHRVPAGEDWQTFYRRRNRERRKTGKSGWIWFAAGAGAILAALSGAFLYFSG